MCRNTRITCVLVSFALVLLVGCSSSPLPPLKSAELKTPLAQFVASPTSRPSPTEKLADMDLKTGDAQYVGFIERFVQPVMPAAGVDDSVTIKYHECAQETAPDAVTRTEPSIMAYVIFNKNVLEAYKKKSIRIPDVVYPRNGYRLDRAKTITFDTPNYAGGQTTLIKDVFYSGEGEWILVYYHMNRNSEGVTRSQILALKDWQRLPESERTGYLAQVEFYTVIGHGEPHQTGIDEEEIRKAEERMDKFVPLFLDKLGNFLPEPVK